MSESAPQHDDDRELFGEPREYRYTCERCGFQKTLTTGVTRAHGIPKLMCNENHDEWAAMVGEEIE